MGEIASVPAAVGPVPGMACQGIDPSGLMAHRDRSSPEAPSSPRARCSRDPNLGYAVSRAGMPRSLGEDFVGGDCADTFKSYEPWPVMVTLLVFRPGWLGNFRDRLRVGPKKVLLVFGPWGRTSAQSMPIYSEIDPGQEPRGSHGAAARPAVPAGARDTEDHHGRSQTARQRPFNCGPGQSGATTEAASPGSERRP
jgi:hypothetical protein